MNKPKLSDYAKSKGITRQAVAKQIENGKLKAEKVKDCYGGYYWVVIVK